MLTGATNAIPQASADNQRPCTPLFLADPSSRARAVGTTPGIVTMAVVQIHPGTVSIGSDV
jgi:hypothetical protein